MVSTRVTDLFLNAGDLSYAYGDKLRPVSRNLLTAPVLATTVDTTLFIADTAYEIESLEYVPTVAGTDAGAVTLAVMKCTGTQAPSAGTLTHTGTANLKGTIHTVQALALSATVANTRLADGDRLAIDVTGVLTAAVGQLTVVLRPLPA